MINRVGKFRHKVHDVMNDITNNLAQLNFQFAPFFFINLLISFGRKIRDHIEQSYTLLEQREFNQSEIFTLQIDVFAKMKKRLKIIEK